MSLLATLFDFRSRDATGSYPLQSAGSKEYLLRHDWSRRLQSATRSQGCLMKTYAILTRPQYHPARFAAMVAGSVPDYFKHKLILLQRLSDWHGPIAERLGETATTSPTKKCHNMIGCRGPFRRCFPSAAVNAEV